LSFRSVSGTTIGVEPGQNVLVAPSLLSADFTRVGEAVRLIASSGGDWIHLDVMDGMFVPNITFGSKMVKDIRPTTHLPMDVHLMIEKPEHHIQAFAEAGADFITFHVEATVHIHRLVMKIKSMGKKAGVSVVPSTPVALLSEILADLDLILVMSVNPGYGGQKFIHQSLDKIAALKDLREKEDHTYLISVDGGIDRQTAPLVLDAGADVLVTGSSFFASADPKDEVHILRGAGA
jgi:ribulose-phosphate 3-epimerase